MVSPDTEHPVAFVRRSPKPVAESKTSSQVTVWMQEERIWCQLCFSPQRASEQIKDDAEAKFDVKDGLAWIRHVRRHRRRRHAHNPYLQRLWSKGNDGCGIHSEYP